MQRSKNDKTVERMKPVDTTRTLIPDDLYRHFRLDRTVVSKY